MINQWLECVKITRHEKTGFNNTAVNVFMLDENIIITQPNIFLAILKFPQNLKTKKKYTNKKEYIKEYILKNTIIRSINYFYSHDKERL